MPRMEIESEVRANAMAPIKLKNATVMHSELSAPWEMESPCHAELAFHLIERGQCWLRIDGAPGSLQLAAGDLLVVRGGQGHTFYDDTDPSVAPACPDGSRDALESGDSSPSFARTTVLLSIAIRCDHGALEPFRQLPDIVHVPARDASFCLGLPALLRKLKQAVDSRAPRKQLEFINSVERILVLVAWHALASQREVGCKH